VLFSGELHVSCFSAVAAPGLCVCRGQRNRCARHTLPTLAEVAFGLFPLRPSASPAVEESLDSCPLLLGPSTHFSGVTFLRRNDTDRQRV
jgi:hypothetical protein